MTPLLTAAFKVDNRVFVELPEVVIKLANIKPGSLFVPKVQPTGEIVLEQAKTEDG